ncbi:MAG TPA: energy transducer TonB [Methylomirabilota bacterium]|nr:energy transducer TonB [Methylomirabilota bacterium]
MLNELSWSRAMPIGLSCLLHVGLVTGLILGQSGVTSVVALQPPVLPIQLVTLDAVEPPRDPAPAPTPRRERAAPIRRPEPPRPREVAAAKIEEPVPQPVAPAPTPAPAPAETAPAPAALAATLPAISEPAAAPGPSAPAASGTTIALPPSAPVVAAKPPATAPEGVTRTARPQGGYQVRPAYPSAPRRLGIQGTTMLRVHVLADGRIGDLLVERSAGHPDLDQAAMEAVRRWRFEPARRGHDAVAMWVLLPVEFRLTQ